MPFEAPGAYWLLLGPGVEQRNTPYDLAAAAKRIRETDYPQAHEFAAGNVLESPSESAMLGRIRARGAKVVTGVGCPVPHFEYDVARAKCSI